MVAVQYLTKYLSFIALAMGVLGSHEAEQERIDSILERIPEIEEARLTALKNHCEVDAMTRLILEFAGSEFEQCVADYKEALLPESYHKGKIQAWTESQFKSKIRQLRAKTREALLQWGDCRYCGIFHNCKTLCKPHRDQLIKECREMLQKIENIEDMMLKAELNCRSALTNGYERMIKGLQKQLDKKLNELDLKQNDDSVLGFVEKTEIKKLLRQELHAARAKEYGRFIGWLNNKKSSMSYSYRSIYDERIARMTRRKTLIEEAAIKENKKSGPIGKHTDHECYERDVFRMLHYKMNRPSRPSYKRRASRTQKVKSTRAQKSLDASLPSDNSFDIFSQID